jgi:hypothetical protein
VSIAARGPAREQRAQAAQEDNMKTVDLLTRRAEARKNSKLFGVHVTIE